MMTVEKLIKELEKFPKDYVVVVEGGEDGDGEWATLTVCENNKEAIWWHDGVTLLTAEDE